MLSSRAYASRSAGANRQFQVPGRTSYRESNPRSLSLGAVVAYLPPWIQDSVSSHPIDLPTSSTVNKAEAVALFGLSRPTCYQAEAAFEREGLAGLLPPRTPVRSQRTRPPTKLCDLSSNTDTLTVRCIRMHWLRWCRPISASAFTHAVSNARWRVKKNDESCVRADSGEATLPVDALELYEGFRCNVRREALGSAKLSGTTQLYGAAFQIAQSRQRMWCVPGGIGLAHSSR